MNFIYNEIPGPNRSILRKGTVVMTLPARVLMLNNLSPFITLPENLLVEKAQGGDATAFAELTRRNYSSSFKLALSILRDRQEAEDEVQNAYWKAFRHLDQFQGDAKFST